MQQVAVTVLLGVGVVTALLCVLGVLLGRDAYQKLHYLGPFAPVSAVSIAAAVVVQESFSPRGIKAALVALVLLAASPVLTHVTARAASLLEQGAPGDRERRGREVEQ